MKKILLSVVLFTLSLYAELTPKIYFELDFKVKDLSIQRQQANIQCAQDSCSKADYYHLEGDYQGQILEIYKTYGVTPVKSLVYANKNKEAIQSYLEEHQEVQDQIELYKQEFEELDTQLKNEMEAQ